MQFETFHIYCWNKTVALFQQILHDNNTALYLTNINKLAYHSQFTTDKKVIQSLIQMQPGTTMCQGCKQLHMHMYMYVSASAHAHSTRTHTHYHLFPCTHVSTFQTHRKFYLLLPHYVLGTYPLLSLVICTRPTLHVETACMQSSHLSMAPY
jgi:hypothetical protein